MKEEWLMSGAVVPVDVETTAALVAEIKRLIDVVGGMALAQVQQEPVAWVCYGAPGKRDIDFEEADINGLPIGTSLYTAPPQSEQEPVAWMSSDRAWMWSDYSKALAAVANIPTLTLIPLYAAPPQREWVGLTDEEIEAIGDRVANEQLVGPVSNFRVRLAQAIEQTLKERNG